MNDAPKNKPFLSSLTEDRFLNFDVQLSGPDNQPLDIPLGGAIGLLALGDIGTIAWRQQMHQAKIELAQRTQAHLATDQNDHSFQPKNSENV